MPSYFAVVSACWTASECSKSVCEVQYPELGDAPPADKATCCSPGTTAAMCGDKNGPGVAPDPNPVRDEDCGDGFVADPTMENRCRAFQWMEWV